MPTIETKQSGVHKKEKLDPPNLSKNNLPTNLSSLLEPCKALVTLAREDSNWTRLTQPKLAKLPRYTYLCNYFGNKNIPSGDWRAILRKGCGVTSDELKQIGIQGKRRVSAKSVLQFKLDAMNTLAELRETQKKLGYAEWQKLSYKKWERKPAFRTVTREAGKRHDWKNYLITQVGMSLEEYQLVLNTVKERQIPGLFMVNRKKYGKKEIENWVKSDLKPFLDNYRDNPSRGSLYRLHEDFWTSDPRYPTARHSVNGKSWNNFLSEFVGIDKKERTLLRKFNNERKSRSNLFLSVLKNKIESDFDQLSNLLSTTKLLHSSRGNLPKYKYIETAGRFLCTLSVQSLRIKPYLALNIIFYPWQILIPEAHLLRLPSRPRRDLEGEKAFCLKHAKKLREAIPPYMTSKIRRRVAGSDNRRTIRNNICLISMTALDRYIEILGDK